MRLPYEKSSRDNMTRIYSQGMESLVETAAVPRTWTNFNSADPGVILFEQLCFLLNDLEYRLAHPVKDILSQFQEYRKKVCDIEGVLYCWFKPMGEVKDREKAEDYDSPSLAKHSIHLLLRADVESERMDDIVAGVKSALANVDFLDTNEIYLGGHKGLQAKRSTNLSSLPYYSAQELYSTYPVSELDFRRLLIDIVGVNNAWLRADGHTPGCFHVILDSSDERIPPSTMAKDDRSTPRQRLAKSVKERLQNFRPLGIEFSGLHWLEEKPLRLDITLDIGEKLIEDLEAFCAQFIVACAEFISPKAVFKPLVKLNEEERQSALSGPILSSGFLTQQALLDCAPKNTLNLARLKKLLLEEFTDQLDFIKRIAIGSEEQGMVVDDIEIDVDRWVPRLKHYCIKLCRSGELIDTIHGDYESETAPQRCDINDIIELQHQEGGKDRKLGLYQGVHTTLPEVFQTGLANQDGMGSEQQKSDAGQLRSYLCFFDFVLYSLHQQLASLADPYNLYQYFPNIHDGTHPNILASLSGVGHVRQSDDKITKTHRLSVEERERLFLLYANNDQEKAQRIAESIPPSLSPVSGSTQSIAERWYSRILKAEHDRVDRFLKVMGLDPEYLGYGNSIPIESQQRLYQIKRDLLILCYHSSGFNTRVNGIPESHSYAIDHTVKRLSLLLEAIYLQNGLQYEEGDKFFYLVDHISQFKSDRPNHAGVPALERVNGLSCFLPADPGAVYLSGLEFKGKGQAYNSDFQWRNGSAVTVEMMVFVPPRVPGVQTLFTLGGLGGHNRFQVHLTDADGWMHFDYGNGGNRASVNFQPYFSRWVHLAVSVDSAEEGTMCIHLDGKLVKQEKRAGHPIQSLSGFHLGRWQIDEYTRYGFYGRIAELRIWAEQLSNEQLQENMGKVLEKGTPNLVLYWPLSKGNYLDFSGYGHALTVTEDVDFPDEPPKRIDLDDNEEDEFVSVYDQFATRVIQELPAHLNLKLYCLSDRLYQWVGKYFTSCTDIEIDQLNQLKYVLLFFEKYCAHKEMITEERIGDITVFSRVMGWIDSFSDEPQLHVSLIEEPNYENGNKTALVSIQFRGGLTNWCRQRSRTRDVSMKLEPSESMQYWQSYLDNHPVRNEIKSTLMMNSEESLNDGDQEMTSLNYRLVLNGNRESANGNAKESHAESDTKRGDHKLMDQ